MEFNIYEDKVIGAVGYEIGGKSSRIKVIAILKNNKTPYMLSEIEAEEFFPPKGFIFEPGFFYNNHYKENDVVSFYIEENKAVENEPDKDKYKIRYKDSKISSYGINARKLRGFQIIDYAVDLSKVRTVDDESNGDFLGVTDKYIVGNLRMKDGIIEPAKYTRIKCWDLNEENILRYNNHIKLHTYPSGLSKVLDCMSDEKLFEWFRAKLRKIDPEYVKLLDNKGKWRTEIPKLFGNTSEDKYEVDKIRFERVKKKLELLELSLSDIMMFIDKSETLCSIFENAIDTHKEEFKSEYEDELNKYFEKREDEKKELIQEVVNLRTRIQDKKDNLSKIKNEIKRLEENKERIIEDFSIIKEVLDLTRGSELVTSNKSGSFIMESIEKNSEATIYSKDEFINELKFQLNKYGLFPNYANKLLEVNSLYNAIFVKDIKLALAFVEATGNAKFIIQQVEPNWLHFKDFWNNGLGAIWSSAHKWPEVLHFLLLQDINLSSPECYARPLLDMMNGVRKRIPFAGTTYPKNLKIVGTNISVSEPEIGLPLIEHTFEGWAAVGFNHDIYRKGNEEYISMPGYINFKLLENLELDEFEKGDLHNYVEKNLEKLFEIE